MVPDPQAVSGKNVLVIDDILTTGATVRSVPQVLLRAGAANVWVATLARAAQAVDNRVDRSVPSGTDSEIESAHAGRDMSQQPPGNGANHLFDGGKKRCRWEKP